MQRVVGDTGSGSARKFRQTRLRNEPKELSGSIYNRAEVDATVRSSFWHANVWFFPICGIDMGNLHLLSLVSCHQYGCLLDPAACSNRALILTSPDFVWPWTVAVSIASTRAERA